METNGQTRISVKDNSILFFVNELEDLLLGRNGGWGGREPRFATKVVEVRKHIQSHRWRESLHSLPGLVHTS